MRRNGARENRTGLNAATKRVPSLLYIHIYTDDGLVGLGETFFGAEGVEVYIHERVAPYLLGKNPLEIFKHWRALYGLLATIAAESRRMRTAPWTLHCGMYGAGQL